MAPLALGAPVAGPAPARSGPVVRLVGPPTGLPARRSDLTPTAAVPRRSTVGPARKLGSGQVALPPALPQVVTAAVDRAALPVALLAVMAAFLMVQSRLDRHDPKLLASWRRDDEELTFRPHPSRPGR